MSLTAQDIHDSLTEDRSKANISAWVEKLAKDPACLGDLIPYISGEDSALAFRFGWLIEHLSNTHPEHVEPHLVALYQALPHANFNGYKRSLAKIFSNCGIPEELEGEVAELLFTWLNSGEIEVAVKVHSMQTLYNLTKRYPDLGYELKEVLEDQMDRNTVAFSARAKRLLKVL